MSGPVDGAVIEPRPAPGAERETASRRPAPSRLRLGADSTSRKRLRLRVRIDARLLDRIVRGRLWIPLLAVFLVGIVGMRVEVLKLGARVGDATKLASQLESTNQVLRDSVSRLSSDQRIEQLAQSYGMVMPGPMDDHFVRAGASLSKAIKSITAPQPATFLAGLRAEQTANGDTAALIATGAGLVSTSSASPIVGSTTTQTSATSTAGGTAGSTSAGGSTSPTSGGSGVTGASSSATTGALGTTGTATGASTASSGAAAPSAGVTGTTGTTTGSTSATGSGAPAPTYGSSSGGASIGG